MKLLVIIGVLWVVILLAVVGFVFAKKKGLLNKGGSGAPKPKKANNRETKARPTAKRGRKQRGREVEQEEEVDTTTLTEEDMFSSVSIGTQQQPVQQQNGPINFGFSAGQPQQQPQPDPLFTPPQPVSPQQQQLQTSPVLEQDPFPPKGPGLITKENDPTQVASKLLKELVHAINQNSITGVCAVTAEPLSKLFAQNVYQMRKNNLARYIEIKRTGEAVCKDRRLDEHLELFEVEIDVEMIDYMIQGSTKIGDPEHVYKSKLKLLIQHEILKPTIWYVINTNL